MKDYKRIKHMRNLNDSLIWERMKRCYDFGYEDGKADTPFTDTEEAEKKAYSKGLSDAWDAAKKLCRSVKYGGIEEHCSEIFEETPFEIFDVFDYTATEAIAKIKAYEDKQKQDAEIKVGDEVTTKRGSKGIVITDEPSMDGCISVWLSTCTHVQIYPVKDLSKTGRHFDAIAEALKELRGAENDE